MRVYELAKQLKMTNKELLDHFHDLGVEVKSHSSSVDDSAIRILYDALEKKRAVAAKTPKAGPSSKPAAVKKSPDVKTTTEDASAEEKAVPDARPKMDARAIALQKINEAKMRRQKSHLQMQTESPVEDAPAPEAPVLDAPPPQEIGMAKGAGAPHLVVAGVEPPQATVEAPPIAPVSVPSPQVVPVAPQAPVPEPRRVEPPRPAHPGAAMRPRVEAPQARRPLPARDARPGGAPSRGPEFRKRTVELEQLPSLPKRAPSRYDRDKDKPLDMSIPPSIEVMKLKTNKVKTKKQKDDEALARKKALKLKGVSTGEKKIRPGRFLSIDSIEETVAKPDLKHAIRPRSKILVGPEKPENKRHYAPPKPVEPKIIKIHGDLTLAELAEKLGIGAAELIAKAMELGEMLSINKLVPPEMVELLAADFSVRIEVVPENDEHDVEEFLVRSEEEKPENLRPRPPVVTIMGHVDHGKTTLLDTIRKTNVAEGEFGGITQHIGAYHVNTDRGEVVFLDTPGHEAFTAMRARGASVTDIVVLIVAADDGLMPQTVEAINHSRAAKVPIIVAINKVDLPGANIQKVRNELMQHSLFGEELGGDTIICEVSAKKGVGIDHLLEMILLQAEIMELKANPEGRAQGVVIESEVDPQRGISATILIRRGTLKSGDPFVCGDVSGRVRLMRDEMGKEVTEAKPAHPVEILGLSGCPQVGEAFLVLESERAARQIAAVRQERRRRQSQNAALKPHVTMEGLADFLKKDDKPKELNIILKADVQGSVEAVSQSMARLSTEKVNIRIIHSGVGTVTESDVQLAMASDALVIGFNIRPDSAAADLARSEGIDIKVYRIIYQLLEELEAAMLGMLDKKFKEVARGVAAIRQVFKVSRMGNIAGCYVTEGVIHRNDRMRLVRDGVVVFEGYLNTLRRVKDDVSSVQAGYECGITLKDYQDIKEGDLIETYVHEEVAQTL
jgi:translation initiation factor IF-2